MVIKVIIGTNKKLNDMNETNRIGYKWELK